MSGYAEEFARVAQVIDSLPEPEASLLLAARDAASDVMKTSSTELGQRAVLHVLLCFTRGLLDARGRQIAAAIEKGQPT